MSRGVWTFRPAWICWLSAGLALSAGCNQLVQSVTAPPAPVVRAAPPERLPTMLPPPTNSKMLVLPTTVLIDPPAANHGPVVPITLDAVLRLASDQNGQINIARAKVHEAMAGKALADKRWLPDLYAGPSYYRHEGGIQDFNGNLIHSSFGGLFAGVEVRSKMDLRDLVFAKVDAERKIWQQHGELAKLTSENLLDAANTYIDLLAARSGEAVGRALEKRLEDLLGFAKKRAQLDKKAEDEIQRVETEIKGQRQINRRLREAATSAAAKLVYLLGLHPDTELVVLDRQIVAFDLVDASVPPHVLVAQALNNGPGIREVQGLLAVIDDARAKAGGAGRFLPTMEVTVAEGAFGAGPGDNMKWDNRLDVLLQARWNLGDLFTSRERRDLAQIKMDQVTLTYVDLQAKLILGVKESREAVLSGRDQIGFAREQIKHAESAYDKSYLRLKEPVFKGSLVDVLFAIKSLTLAQFDLARAIRGYDQAQIRLLVLTGTTDPAYWADHGARGNAPPCASGFCPPRR